MEIGWQTFNNARDLIAIVDCITPVGYGFIAIAIVIIKFYFEKKLSFLLKYCTTLEQIINEYCHKLWCSVHDSQGCEGWEGGEYIIIDAMYELSRDICMLQWYQIIPAFSGYRMFDCNTNVCILLYKIAFLMV